MQIRQNVSLSHFSTMRLGGNATYLSEVTSKENLIEVLNFANAKSLETIMIGGGSNIVWADSGFEGLVIVNRIMGYDSKTDEGGAVQLEVGAGENWDRVVERSVRSGLTGIEALSLIPGLAGATPVQNVGAYGQEISQSLFSLEAYDKNSRKFVTIHNKDCGFGYRTSRFKTHDHGRYLIVSLNLRLKVGNPRPPFYPAVSYYIDQKEITSVTPQVIREAVIEIRQKKLPDPEKIANNGSFFANPIITKNEFETLLSKYPHVIYWKTSDHRYKISAAWLIEIAGFKDYHDHETGMATWPKQSLVLINEHAHSTHDLIKFRDKIITSVERISGITLHQEPELLPG